MIATKPHVVLFSETQEQETGGRWRFVVQGTSTQEELSACDTEPGLAGERLELLSVVRGLEALDQPSRVTLVTQSRYVSQGLNYGLEEWRETNWCWERYGELVPVKNLDLWQRIECAMKFHQVECRIWRFDAPHAPGPVKPAMVSAHQPARAEGVSVSTDSRHSSDNLSCRRAGRRNGWGDRVRQTFAACRSALLARPRLG